MEKPDLERLKIVYRDPKALVAYDKNSRTHTPEQIEALRRSIREFGFTNPVLLKDDDATIGAGHARCEAALAEGIDSIPTITLPGLDEAKWRAYVIADNQLAINGSGWDFDTLASEMDWLKDSNFDLSLLGFDDKDVFSIFLDKQEGETDPNAEWTGMPDFEMQPRSFRSFVVHFDDAAAVADFEAKIGQQISGKAKYIWHPTKERKDLKSSKWMGEDES